MAFSHSLVAGERMEQARFALQAHADLVTSGRPLQGVAGLLHFSTGGVQSTHSSRQPIQARLSIARSAHWACPGDPG